MRYSRRCIRVFSAKNGLDYNPALTDYGRALRVVFANIFTSGVDTRMFLVGKTLRRARLGAPEPLALTVPTSP